MASLGNSDRSVANEYDILFGRFVDPNIVLPMTYGQPICLPNKYMGVDRHLIHINSFLRIKTFLVHTYTEVINQSIRLGTGNNWAAAIASPPLQIGNSLILPLFIPRNCARKNYIELLRCGRHSESDTKALFRNNVLTWLSAAFKMCDDVNQ